MKKLLLLLLILQTISIFGTIHKVNQNGNEEFTMIQNAINQATHGDTILVFPGIYYENLNFYSKALTLGSLTLTTDSLHYRENTVIDGNNEGHCIKVQDVTSNDAKIIGFTIQNGYAAFNNFTETPHGSGILIYDCTTNVYIEKNIIKGNKAMSCGGGLCSIDSEVYLKNNVIKENNANDKGGGVVSFKKTLIFDSMEKNSIFNNTGLMGADLAYVSYEPEQPDFYIEPVYLDTFTTTSDNDLFYASQEYYNLFHSFDLHFEHTIYEEIDADLYVSPDGDDANSGRTPEEPLQTILYAMQRIKSNQEHRNSIFLLDGIYSETNSNQQFPIQLKSWVNIIGENEEYTIIDGEGINSFLRFRTQLGGNKIENLTAINLVSEMINFSRVFLFTNVYSHDVYLEPIELSDITVANCYSESDFVGGNIFVTDANTILRFNNCTFKNNTGSVAIGSSQTTSEPKLIFENSIFQNNIGTIGAHVAPYSVPNNSAIFKNSLIADNVLEYDTVDNWHFAILGGGNFDNFNIINCTVANNAISAGAAIHAGGPYSNINNVTNYNIINSILYGNVPTQAYVTDDNSISIAHSLIPDITGVYAENGVNWGDGIVIGTPQFDTENQDHPYMLLPQSLAINAGTQDTTGLNLPAYDLAGNPRIYDGRIDLGCYEFQGVPQEEEEIIPAKYNLKCYPNPFSFNANSSRSKKMAIQFNTIDNEKVNVTVYNIKGQKIKTLYDCFTTKGSHELFWDGKNKQNESVASGQYFIKLTVGDMVLAKKMLIVK